MTWSDLSLMWTIIHTLVLFIMLYESRYTGKKNIILTCATMIPLILVNFVLLLVLGLNAYNHLMFLTLSLPSLIIFWLMAKNRDGRFFFTFCLVDTVTLGITYLTNILDVLFVPGEFIFAAAVRFAVYPLIEWAVVKKLRPTYLEVQRFTKKGWGYFAGISALFYVGIILIPTPITRDSEALPLVFLIFILMPTIYANIITTLRDLKVSHETAQREAILRLQVDNMATRMEELNEADKKFRMERHNFRHKLKTIASLVETGQYDELSALLEEYNESIKEGQVTRSIAAFCEKQGVYYSFHAEDNKFTLQLNF